MDFAIPADLPVNDGGVEIDDKKRADEEAAAKVAKQKGVTSQEAKTFLVDHDLVPLLNELLTDVILANADDPIDLMTRWFLRHTPASDAERAEDDEQGAKAALEQSKMRNSEVSQQHDTAVRYCAEFCLPQLIDELLTAMINEAPDDQGRFAMSWLRWNKKSFIFRHKPPRYADFIARENLDRDRTPATGEEKAGDNTEATEEAKDAAPAA